MQRIKMALREIPVLARNAIFVLSAVLSFGVLVYAQNWDRFRGPNGSGQGEAVSIPTEWREEHNLWKQSLPGVGHSSPVVWGDRVFVTSADRQTAEQVLAAFDANSGKPLWERRLPGAPYPIHAQNSFASSTPAVDANRIYVPWRAQEAVSLVAFSHAGEEVWRREVARGTDENGFGVSPIIVDDVVILPIENEVSDSTIVGLDAASGEIRWRVPRPSGKSPYCTPCTVESAGGEKLFVTASTAAGMTAFDPASGQVVWQAIEKDLPQRIVASPIEAGGLVMVTCGLTGNGLHLVAVRHGAGKAPPSEAYRITENVPYVPTPVVAGDLLFLWNDRGTVSCHELATGKQLWRQRVGGNFNSSPIHVGGRIYCSSLEGEVVVLAADRNYRLLARNLLGEPTSATPAVANGRMYLRSESSLFCIGEPTRGSE